MRITHLGHACLLVETDGARLLIDPGTYSSGFEELTGLDAVIATHQHPDHLDPDQLPGLRGRNPEAQILLETETVDTVDSGDALTAVAAGWTGEIGDVALRAVGGRHAVNHDQVPTPGNVGFLATAGGTTVFHPGDSYDEAPDGVDVLGLPLNAPWCRMSETLAFLRAVSPRLVVPIHTGLLSENGRAAYLMHVQRFGPEGAEVVDLRPGSSYDV